MLRSALVVAASAIVLLASQSVSVYAATKKAAPTPEKPTVSNTLKVSPLRSDVVVKAGASGSVLVRVTNLAATPVTLKAIENDFVAGDEKGTPSVILDQNSYAPSHSLKRFMVGIPDFTVAAGGTQEITVKIAVPKTAQAGGYFGALRFIPSGTEGQPVDVTGSVVSLILLTVPGPTLEQMTLTNFDVRQNGGTASNFRSPDDLSVLVRFENKGNVQEQPFGQINVQKGKKVIYTYDFNQDQPRNSVLPDSARRWEVPIKNLGKFGKYTVSGTFGYGLKGETINISKTVWIVPTGYILAGVGIFIFLVVAIGGTYVFLRSYKRKILESSRRRY